VLEEYEVSGSDGNGERDGGDDGNNGSDMWRVVVPEEMNEMNKIN
jgi:hypothetical protein